MEAVLDENEDGEICGEELHAWLSWKFLMANDERLYEVAKRIDKNQNGKISMHELREQFGDEYAAAFRCLFGDSEEIDIEKFLKRLKSM